MEGHNFLRKDRSERSFMEFHKVSIDLRKFVGTKWCLFKTASAIASSARDLLPLHPTCMPWPSSNYVRRSLAIWQYYFVIDLYHVRTSPTTRLIASRLSLCKLSLNLILLNSSLILLNPSPLSGLPSPSRNVPSSYTRKPKSLGGKLNLKSPLPIPKPGKLEGV